MQQSSLDEAIQTYYAELFDEGARLTTRSSQGRLEFDRTQAVVRQFTAAPARVLDVGGATGVHAAALADAGYDVVLVDPVPSQVQRAAAHGTFECLVGDARQLDFPDDSFDAVLMAGPLYHLATQADRRLALAEAARVCRPGGYVHAAAIPRFLAFAAAELGCQLVASDPVAALALLREGTPPPTVRFPAGHFHTPEELEREMLDAGLVDVGVVGIEGPAGLALELTDHASPADCAAAARIAETFQSAPLVRNFSCHILGTGRVVSREPR